MNDKNEIFVPGPGESVVAKIEQFITNITEQNINFSNICYMVSKQEAAILLREVSDMMRPPEKEAVEKLLMQGLGHIKVHKSTYLGMTIVVKGMF